MELTSHLLLMIVHSYLRGNDVRLFEADTGGMAQYPVYDKSR